MVEIGEYMKKTIFAIFLIVALFFQVIAETTRESLYQKFGPILIEAIVKVTMDEINLIRAELGLPARTNQQLMDAIKNKLDGLELYDWMNE